MNEVDGAKKPALDVVGMDDATTNFAAMLFVALAHPTRLKIVEILTDQSRSVSEVADEIGILPNSASQHMGILNRAGVAKSVQEGSVIRYTLRGPRIAQIMRLVDEFRSLHSSDLL
ncbi:hypothetical protein CCAX7_61240 [Capsulimonas corticalis]|uniref:Uncharacterized protein n=1 Tax=Capsulimonas corticalis TaxID=2219043 RepID=A0A402CW87_9BACT|nr:metalloregulator ArsR/SmtB family transcription factor [Capsulimonas corticalis]BDI34073.1 hypothetical protein CCAX7_61240 [Capsulimonas corticalis]